jgi:hypothetical protein
MADGERVGPLVDGIDVHDQYLLPRDTSTTDNDGIAIVEFVAQVGVTFRISAPKLDREAMNANLSFSGEFENFTYTLRDAPDAFMVSPNVGEFVGLLDI